MGTESTVAGEGRHTHPGQIPVVAGRSDDQRVGSVVPALQTAKKQKQKFGLNCTIVSPQSLESVLVWDRIVLLCEEPEHEPT